jgi:Uma2 family endonuclease
MHALPELSEENINRYVDQRTLLHQIDWEQFEALLAMRGDRAGPRLAYLDGELEFMSPSELHESLKTMWARLLEAWSEEANIELEGRGSWTLKTSPKKKGGLEPDECYFVGGRDRKKVPDLALEVVWTHGGLDRLEIYRRLGIREVWIWEGGEIQLYVLGRLAYEQRSRSELLPSVDIGLFLRCLKEPTQAKALKRLRATLRKRLDD